ncbi:MAG: CvpA family protein [Firmicutes bacterium]|jgi:membrane protein required for colicin V production|nr:CvpA family protein [Bacillota bacterium]
MDWLSLVILIFIGVMVITGLRKGFVRQILGLVGLVASIMLALKYYDVAGEFIIVYFAVPEGLAPILGFTAICICVAAAVSVLGWVWGKLVKYSPVSILDSLGGALFGFAKGALVVMIVLLVVYALPFEGARQTVDDSSVARGLIDLSPMILKNLEDIIPGGIPYITDPKNNDSDRGSVPPILIKPGNEARKADAV